VIETIKVTDQYVGIGGRLIPEAGVQCFPNPADGLLHVKSTGHLQKIVISNQWGAQVLTTEASGTLSVIDVTPLSSGLYIMEVVSENGATTLKFIRK
jgi:hypothetical protein